MNNNIACGSKWWNEKCIPSNEVIDMSGFGFAYTEHRVRWYFDYDSDIILTYQLTTFFTHLYCNC